MFRFYISVWLNVVLSLIAKAWMYPCIKWEFSGAQEQFWLDALSDATQ